MAKTRIEKIEEIDREREQLLNERNRLVAAQKEADRKARTNRICDRGCHIESVLPETMQLNKEQFRNFINRTLLTNYAKRELEEILTQPAEMPTKKATDTETATTEVTIANEPKANQQEKK
jgi:hypothetical protein